MIPVSLHWCTNRDEAYVKVTSEEALDAILLHDNEMIGKRNIEVLVSSPQDMETARENSKIKVRVENILNIYHDLY
jgi:hypothetical protein